MTSQQDHPITPPPELVEEWANASARTHRENGTYAQHEFALATQAARWAADQELEACCEWLEDFNCSKRFTAELRGARRPKPPSLRELALASVKRFEESGEFFSDQMRELEFIRKALEQLDD